MDDLEFKQRLDKIRKDHSHGATELARKALDVLARSAYEIRTDSTAEAVEILSAQVDKVLSLRPGMAPIANLASEWSTTLEEHRDQPLDFARKAWAAHAEWVIENSRSAVAQTATNTVDLVLDGMTVMTHSLSSTLVGAFRQLAGRDVKIIVTESRPQNEGYWLAKVLSEIGVHHDLVTEAQMALAVQEADLVLVGAESLTHDGSVINKVGTHLLALAAREYGVPVYVCCETFKKLPEGAGDIELESMDPAEVGAPSYPYTQVRNTWFDITPVELLEGWVNEETVVDYRLSADSVEPDSP
ncbi:MAG: translation initiation factor eIF-2B [bacterium]